MPRNIDDILTPLMPAQPVAASKFLTYITNIKNVVLLNSVATGQLYRDEMFGIFGLVTAFPSSTVESLLASKIPAGTSPVKNPYVLGIATALVLDTAAGPQPVLRLVVGSCDGIARFLFGQKRNLDDPNSSFLPINEYALRGQASIGRISAPRYQALRSSFIAPVNGSFQGFGVISAQPVANPAEPNASSVWFDVPLSDIYDMIYDSPAINLGGNARFQAVLKITDPSEQVAPPQNQYIEIVAHLNDVAGTPVSIFEGPTIPMIKYQHGGGGGS